LNVSKSLTLIALIAALAFSTTLAYGYEDKNNQPACSKTEKKMTEPKMGKSKAESKTSEDKMNLKKMDKDKNGKVYQCPSHPRKTSDVSGFCPVCNTSMVFVSIKDAKACMDKKKAK